MFDKEIIRETVHSVMPDSLISQIIVFGSMSRGDATADSDVDICIITHDDINYDDAKVYRGQMNRIFAFKHRISTDILLKSSNDLERYRNVAGAIENEIMRDGMVI